MAFQLPIRAVVLNLGDLLFKPSLNIDVNISSGTLPMLLSSPTWYEYKCGRLEQHSCYEKLATEFSLRVSEIAGALTQALESLRPSNMVVNLIKDFRKRTSLKVYCMSNIVTEIFDSCLENPDWFLFDGIFPSGELAIYRPEPSFYHFVLEELKLPPEQVMVVDNKSENVLAAKTLGMKGMVFDNSTINTLQSLIDDPVIKAFKYMHSNAKQFDSLTDGGVVVADNFARLLILEATNDRDLVDLNWKFEGTWNYFAGEATLVPGGYFPDDLDTTSLALTTLRPDQSNLTNPILDKMLEFVNSDGSVLTYFDREKPRTDAVVSANVLTCFYAFGRGYQVSSTLKYIHDVILHRIYLEGTRYYPSPDCCLGFFSRLLHFSAQDVHLQTMLRPLLKLRVQERVGKDGSALDLAMRIIACKSLSVDCQKDLQALLKRQCQDGSWEPGWMYRYGSTGVRIGNRGVTTAMAIKAIATPGTP